MATQYVAGVWARKYRKLAPRERQLVNEQTNQMFRERTKVFRKLDPRHDRELCDRWLQFRDIVMEQNARSGYRGEGFLGLPLAKQVFDGVGRGVQVVEDVVESIARAANTPWMDVAKEELRRGVAVVKGKEAHPRIIMYAQTCPHLFSTENKRKYMENNGDEGFKWCSAFVNWCLSEVGIVGTRHALAMSWLKWGKTIEQPQHGAIVILKTKSWNHVAFVENVGGTFKMLGGNQKPEHGKGPQCVSYQKIIPSQVVGYRLPQ